MFFKMVNLELNFMRIMDVNFEERFIFGFLVDYWEVVLMMKKFVWDGKGILNLIYKYWEVRINYFCLYRNRIMCIV